MFIPVPPVPPADFSGPPADSGIVRICWNVGLNTGLRVPPDVCIRCGLATDAPLTMVAFQWSFRASAIVYDPTGLTPSTKVVLGVPVCAACLVVRRELITILDVQDTHVTFGDCSPRFREAVEKYEARPGEELERFLQNRSEQDSAEGGEDRAGFDWGSIQE